MASSAEAASTSLARLLSRLEQKFPADSTHLFQGPRPSAFDLARLKTAESDAAAFKNPSQRQKSLNDLQQQRIAMKRLDDLLTAWELLEDKTVIHVDEPRDVDVTQPMAGADIPAPGPTTLPQLSTTTEPQAAVEPSTAPTATIAPSNEPASILRNRFQNSSTEKADPSVDDQLLHDQHEQDNLSDSLLKMAAQLKENSRRFADDLEGEKDVLRAATEGLDKNTAGIQKAGLGMLQLKQGQDVTWWYQLKVFAALIGLIWTASRPLFYLHPSPSRIVQTSAQLVGSCMTADGTAGQGQILGWPLPNLAHVFRVICIHQAATFTALFYHHSPVRYKYYPKTTPLRLAFSLSTIVSLRAVAMRSSRRAAVQRIQAFSNTTPATRSKLPTPRKRTTISQKAEEPPQEEKEAGEAKDLSDDSELSSAPSDLESIYSDSAKDASSDEEYTSSPYFASAKTGSQPSKKRKRTSKAVDTKSEPVTDDSESPPSPKPAKQKPKTPKRAPAKGKKTNGAHLEIRYDPPDNWREMYDAIKEMRLRIPAPVDTVGCARLAQIDVSPKVKRFQHLIALMMSSQTKDQVTGDAMRRLQTELPGGLTLESILAVPPARLNQLIGQVGFHNRKTEYIKKAAVVLRDKFNGDIPETVEDMMSLDGVGPKMSYLLEQCAWNRATGIGVDVHVHRIANLFKWVPQSSEPETTRIYLQSWLPKELWTEINWLLVGFGQSVCLPRGRRCDICTLGPKSTGGNGMCKASIVVKTKASAVKVKREVKVEQDDEEIVVKKEEEVVEEGVVERTDPLGIDEDTRVVIKKEEVKEEEDAFPTAIPDIEDAVGRPKRKNVKRKR
ncbi:LOW QUALITY PROTEIN: hypothetical protein Dda_7729 [Drechslerella dactyloides]|uniref:Endonuclease III homolog n=1 Tax=Drechslerella dactyloides TaxID=74499 RepID=A0AAD6ISQ2_DREDA|nr:LOW QUALITY PROTEIN: hypothetical protein Dda_7729 [Drechslerella dactyloides]